jgi:death-on-curing protein
MAMTLRLTEEEQAALRQRAEADLVDLAERLFGPTPPIRDVGLLGSAAARPRTTVFGADAYPDLWTKAAALLDSIVNNHALVDGNKRLG